MRFCLPHRVAEHENAGPALRKGMPLLGKVSGENEADKDAAQKQYVSGTAFPWYSPDAQGATTAPPVLRKTAGLVGNGRNVPSVARVALLIKELALRSPQTITTLISKLLQQYDPWIGGAMSFEAVAQEVLATVERADLLIPQQRQMFFCSSDGQEEYMVDLTDLSCNCPHFSFRVYKAWKGYERGKGREGRRVLCKHGLAAALILNVAKQFQNKEKGAEI